MISNELKDKITELSERQRERLISDRREIHKFPETEFEEFKTQKYITSRLDELGLSYETGIAKTGTLVTIKGRENGRTILLRADIDALDIMEQGEAEYKSVIDGKMHACGHDAHTAVMLGVCSVLAELKDEISGTVKIVFQPAEEGQGGAEPMIAEGVMENPRVDACLALHTEPELECGKIRVKSGAMYGSPDEFEIIIKGKSGHGAEPHLCVDPILVSAQVIVALQSVVSRRISPFESAVVSLCSICGGTNTNVIPDSVRILGTARSQSSEVRNKLPIFIEDTVKGICSAFGAEYEMKFSMMFPPLINSEEMADVVRASAVRQIGEENTVFGGSSTMAGEDFAYFANAAPSAIFKLGVGNKKKGIVYPLHNSKFDIDEDSLVVGVKVMTDAVFEYLSR